MTFTQLPRIDESLLPAEVAPAPTPKLYVYEHCPFCVRVRYVLNLKRVRYDTVWLLNDDFTTPEALVGKKLLPILEADGLPNDKSAMGESLDIISFLDGDDAYGAPGLFRPASGRSDIEAVFTKLAPVLWRLCLPRIANTPEFPELATQGARDCFVKRHPIKEPPHDYQTNIDRSDEFIKVVNGILPELESAVFSKQCVSEGGISIDDVLFFPQLRVLSAVKGIKWPPKLREYMEYQALQSDICLLDRIAL